ncbi:PREDICTED: meprin A subunit beta [Hipposideros armiger]|uniref:Metalloendopeptidase n=1 Tax=Hipposideros armiger TaxID=186990 RepID=A0A8B7S4T8_HIPAR|nr:PREDICTED: meprin A subunit beta [Hipposideros armiger]
MEIRKRGGTASDYKLKDVDGGLDQDIFDINEDLGLDLFEGDIKLDSYSKHHQKALETSRRNQDKADLGTTGSDVIFGVSCWSSVGNRHVGRQELSIGANCDRIATIQHEFLHALGFWHEQSRSDRDDYVNIIWDRIQSDNGNYHWDKPSKVGDVAFFPNGTEFRRSKGYGVSAFITHKRLRSRDFIKGDDVYILLTVEASSLSFMDSCNFELENVCGMIQSSSDNADWQRVSQVPRGPESDHSNMGQCKDIPIGNWQLYHVTLKVTKKFRVVFEGVRGTSTSLGGLSIDDINLSETRCPHHIWHIRNFTQFIGSPNGDLYSPPFYSSKGYAFQIYLDLKHLTNAGIYFHLISGANDDQLQWPCPWQQATMTLLDQNPDIRQRMSNQRSVTTDPFMTTGSCPSGDDWWYMGERCEKKGSTRDTIVIATSSTVAVFAVMLIVTLVSVYCTRKRYRKKISSNTAAMALENVS